MAEAVDWNQFRPPWWQPPTPPPPPVIEPSEADRVDTWIRLLSPHFEIEQEVWGVHWTGRRLRIDMLLHPRNGWPGGGHQPIGFEVKRRADEVGPLTKAAGQAVDYAQSRWQSDIARDMNPLIYVAVFDALSTPHDRAVLDRMLGRLGVGFFRADKWRDLRLDFTGNIQWTLARGMVGGQFDAIRKIGSR